ncbi:hybrid sensor histidine kinase/response regulator [Trichloromonas sp.]|uniref:hybrid sensor histidine kinase/response regulator n=1 Tax=Trichloromonas sp. TaxID=3069249 RepID=UPI003D818EB1
MDSSRYIGIFCREAEEHLQTLRQGLMALEKQGVDPERMRPLLRSVHTLKGSARLLNLVDFSSLTHAIEDQLKDLERGERPVTAEWIDLLLAATESLASMVAAVAAGSEPGFAVAEVIAGLASGTLAPPAAERPSAAADEPKAGIESVRTSVAQIDRLVNLLGEVSIVREAFTDRSSRLGGLLRQLDLLLPGLRQSEVYPRLRQLRGDLRQLATELERDVFSIQYLADELQGETTTLRMLPLAVITGELEGLLRKMAREQGKQVDFVVSGDEQELDRRMLESIRPMLVHLLRNAVDHGIETAAERSSAGKPATGRIELRASFEGGAVQLVLCDDGRGLDPELLRQVAVKRRLLSLEEARALSDEQALYLILRPGFSTREIVTDHSGRGIGMDVVKTTIDQVKGNLQIQSSPGKGTTIVLQFPLTLAVINGLIVACEAETFVVPLHYLVEILQLEAADILTEGGREVVRARGLTMPLVSLQAILGLSKQRSVPVKSRFTALVLNFRGQLLACQVSRSLGVQEVVVKNLGDQLRQVRFFTGATVLPSGQPALILSVAGLFGAGLAAGATHLQRDLEAQQARAVKGRILVVDDSVTTRTMEKNILEARGYQVTVAVSGEDALGKLATQIFDLVVSDVEMPGISGFELTEKIRENEQTRDLPVIIVTSFAADEDKRRGIAVGAQAYIVKGSFDQGLLLQAVETFIG